VLSPNLSLMASKFCSFVLLAMILLSCLRETCLAAYNGPAFELNQPCDKIYVVKEGETLDSISDKCDDPFILKHNPHINDPDDVFPGLVINLTPLTPLQLSKISLD
ncbi:LysM domain-containing protein, partial [Cephalotus follicularis]